MGYPMRGPGRAFQDGVLGAFMPSAPLTDPWRQPALNMSSQLYAQAQSADAKAATWSQLAHYRLQQFDAGNLLHPHVPKLPGGGTAIHGLGDAEYNESAYKGGILETANLRAGADGSLGGTMAFGPGHSYQDGVLGSVSATGPGRQYQAGVLGADATTPAVDANAPAAASMTAPTGNVTLDGVFRVAAVGAFGYGAWLVWKKWGKKAMRKNKPRRRARRSSRRRSRRR